MNEKLEFLKKTEPFNLLPAPELEFQSEHLKEIVYSKKEIIYHQHTSKLKGLDLIVKGGYEVFFYDSSGQKNLIEELGPQSSYGAFSILLNNDRSIKTVSVDKATRIFQLEINRFKKLCQDNENFYQFFLSEFGRELLDERFSKFAIRPGMELETLTFDRYFTRRLDSVLLRPIVSCPQTTPTWEAAEIMEKEKLSCLFVEEIGEYVGYVTDIILRNKIVAQRKSADTIVAEVMEGPIYSVDKSSFIYEAILKMFETKSRYLLVEENGQHVGVISRNKLLSDQAQSPFVFIQSVRQAVNIDELKNRWDAVPEVVYNLLSRGVKSELVNQVITQISDTISKKVIEAVIEKMGPPPARFCFMSLGSEGRKELTLKTDQDNAIIYEDKANQFREKTREYFLEFATRVSEDLNFIGFVFCTGGLMAKNPKWTHSLSHWKRNYDQWIDQLDFKAAMNFSTFFDCRIIYGDEELIKELQTHILKKLDKPSEYFFALLAENALQYQPPLSFFKGIRTISKGDQQVFNIKRAMTPIVDLVRVYALKHKITKTNTGERLHMLHELKILSDDDFHELMQSYYYLMGMRLKHQAHQISYGHKEPDNFVPPDTLTKIEIVTLKEIFKVIADFQQRIRLIFTRNMLG